MPTSIKFRAERKWMASFTGLHADFRVVAFVLSVCTGALVVRAGKNFKFKRTEMWVD